ncbi:ATP synthase subunit b precursor [Gimesia maris]|jgi:F-type H+-transporting ATPase subunit b|uniref:ATP synthase subunit b n=2 Tax=Gimesia maris TaxID=122 RepID=A0A3D3RAH7_9PLAN|nr:ATP synthase F0 subunit B [Gimesia sp.]QDT79596.1 ATP synthase subunit b precursor [Gimesia maris]QDU15231.1 ATP synthase subunit b precursor [Gimesia maris]QEG17196.1 ATP synthase subunit b precursor [Gimesia maris]QGQ29705.1 F0F1 ATP synthase subunit B [Gimesia maris]
MLKSLFTSRCLIMLMIVSGVILGSGLLGLDASLYAAEGAEHPSGPPLHWKTDLALWSLIVFVVFIFVLRAFAWGPLIQALDERELRVITAINTAESKQKESEELVKEHARKIEAAQDEIQAMMVEARSDADRIKQDVLAQARQEAESIKTHAVDEIERARELALKDLFDQINGRVIDATEQVLGRALNESDRDRLINEALSQISGSSN